MAEKTKQCRKCLKPKKLGDFRPRKNATDGRFSVCNECLGPAMSRSQVSTPKNGQAVAKAVARPSSKRHVRARQAVESVNDFLAMVDEVVPAAATPVGDSMGALVRQLRKNGIVVTSVVPSGKRKIRITYQKTEEVVI